MYKARIIFLLVVLLLLLGCNKKETYLSNTTIQSTQLRDFVQETNGLKSLGNFYLPDSTYRVPKEDWVLKKLQPAVYDFISQNNLAWQYEERNDCDNFANYGHAVANIINNKDNDKLSGISVGTFSFMGVNKTIYVHALVLIVVEDANGKLKLVFYDPTIMQVYPAITKQDEVMIFDIRF